jgi:ankyrin repeat protein
VHYASKMGFVNILKVLINRGASFTTKNNEKQSPLHFAAKYGRYTACLELLNSENYKNYINEKDSNGYFILFLISLSFQFEYK